MFVFWWLKSIYRRAFLYSDQQFNCSIRIQRCTCSKVKGCMLINSSDQSFMDIFSIFRTRELTCKSSHVHWSTKNLFMVIFCKIGPFMYIEVQKSVVVLDPTHFFGNRLTGQHNYNNDGCCFVTSKADILFREFAKLFAIFRRSERTSWIEQQQISSPDAFQNKFRKCNSLGK